MPLSDPVDSTTSPASRRSKGQPAVALGIGLLVLLAFAIRVWRIDFQSLSNDEVIEVEDAGLSAWQIIHSPDGFPPLFRLLLAAALTPGNHPLIGRWLSVCFGVLTIPLIADWTRRMAGSTAAMIAAAVSGLSPFLVYYAQESRPYSLFILLGTATCYSLYCALASNNKRDWGCFVAASTLGAYTHYYMALIVAAAGIVWLLDRIQFRQPWGRGLVAFAAVGLLSLPVGWLMHDDFSFTQDFAAEVPGDLMAMGYSYFSFLSGFAFGPSTAELHDLVGVPSRAIRAMLPAIGGSLALLAVPLALGFVGQFRDRRCFVAMLCFTVIPVALAVLLSAALQLNYNVRYVAPAAVPCLIMIAIGIDRLRPRWLCVLALLAAMTWLGSGSIRRHTIARYYNEDVKSTARWLAEQSSTNDVFVMTDYMARTLRYYTDPRLRVLRFPDPNSVMWTIHTSEDLVRALQMVKEQAAAEQGCWVAVMRAFHGDPHRLLRTWLATNPQTRQVAAFPGVAVWYWSLADPRPVGDHSESQEAVVGYRPPMP